MALKLPQAAKPMVDFAIHVVVGACGFIVILGITAAISAFVKLIDGTVPPWVAMGAEWAELGLFGLDLALFGLFVVSEALKLIRGLLNEWRA
jgi:hypothetical protein